MIPKKLKSKTIKEILTHAEEGYPNEICGVVVMSGKVEHYVRCVNLSTDPTEEFKMCPESFADASELGDVVGIVHSHPDGTSAPSLVDRAVMSRNREIELLVDPDSKSTPWHIVSWPEGDYRQIIPEAPEGLLDRPFVHNVWDCWATCEGYYRKYHNLTFPKQHRDDRWWEDKNAFSFYEELYEDWGFVRVDGDPIPGDMIVMQIGRTHHPNHAGIYLGDISEFEGKQFHGSALMLHHMYGKKSEVIVYGGQWHQRTSFVLRHKELINVTLD